MKKQYTLSYLLILLMLGLISCKKTPEIINTTNKKELPTLSTNAVSNITSNSATSGGEITNNGNLDITSRGVCWSTTENPSLDHNLGYTVDGSGIGNFTSNISGLTENTTYYVTAYATNEIGTAYGSIKSFTTLEITLPTITTTTPIDITINSGISGGDISNDGNSTVTSRGVCWNTIENPSLDNNLGYTSDGSGIGNFTSNISGLTENTTYYVTAYATNEIGTAYGSIKNLTTVEITLPSVTTTAPTNIQINSVTSGGNVTTDGNSMITNRGVCWNSTGNPTLSNNDGFTTDGSGTGVYTSNISDLDENTTYYVVAYATNEIGTAYGVVKLFTTFESPCGSETTISYEGQIYNLIEIGAQCWFKENLNVGTRINGNQEMQNNSIIEKYCYNDNEANCDIYGGLYQWDEMMQYSTTEGVQGFCPDGWHIPTDNEWMILVDFLGGDDIAGGKLKEAGYEHWSSPNSGATNSSGFTAFPGGARTDYGSFNSLGENGWWWTSSEENDNYKWSYALMHYNEITSRNHNYYPIGLSVRCLKD